MSDPTPFCQAVIGIIAAAPNGIVDADTLRHATMDKGFGKHPAAVAMNLTKLAWRHEYVAAFVSNAGRHFCLTTKGRQFVERRKA